MNTGVRLTGDASEDFATIMMWVVVTLGVLGVVAGLALGALVDRSMYGIAIGAAAMSVPLVGLCWVLRRIARM